MIELPAFTFSDKVMLMVTMLLKDVQEGGHKDSGRTIIGQIDRGHKTSVHIDNGHVDSGHTNPDFIGWGRMCVCVQLLKL